MVVDLRFILDKTEHSIRVPVASTDPLHHHALGASLVSIANLGMDVAPTATSKLYVIAGDYKAALSGRALAEVGLVFSPQENIFLFHGLERVWTRKLNETLVEDNRLRRF